MKTKYKVLLLICSCAILFFCIVYSYHLGEVKGEIKGEEDCPCAKFINEGLNKDLIEYWYNDGGGITNENVDIEKFAETLDKLYGKIYEEELKSEDKNG